MSEPGVTPEEARDIVVLVMRRRWVTSLKEWSQWMKRGVVTIDELRALCTPTIRALHMFHHLVPSKNIVALSSWPQRTFRIRRLVIQDAIAGDFVIHNLRIGNRPQFWRDNSALTGAMFAASGPGMDLEVEPVLAGSRVVLDVEYVGKEHDGAVFQGTWLGMDEGGSTIALPINSLEPVQPTAPEIITIDLDEDRYHFAIQTGQLTALSRMARPSYSSPPASISTTFEADMSREDWQMTAISQRGFDPPLPIALHVEHFSEVPYTVLYGIDEATDRVVFEIGEGMASSGRPFQTRCEPEGYVPSWWNWRRAEEAP